MSLIRLVTFDVTGTLLNFRTPVMSQYADIAAKFGIKSEPIDLMKHFKKGWKELNSIHPNFGRPTGLGWREWWHKIVRLTFTDQIHSKEEEQKIRAVGDVLIEQFETEKSWKVADGTFSLLDSLKEENIQIGVISNFDPRLHTILENLSLKEYFSFVLTSYEVGYEKPDARIFHSALRASQVSRPSDVVHVGNEARLDYNGATTAGFNGILISAESPVIIPKLVNSLCQVKECIDFLNEKVRH